MKEARELIYNYVFNMLKVDILVADVWEGNVNSIKSLEHAGYKLVDVKRENFKKYNRMNNKLIINYIQVTGRPNLIAWLSNKCLYSPFWDIIVFSL